jgi:NAD(P)-dependent dehydrogenase (short-subunit alcohol dehydrogenase family)
VTSAVVFGASGGLGMSLVSELLGAGLLVKAVTRSPASPEILREIGATHGRLQHEHVDHYTLSVHSLNTRYVFFAQGVLIEAPIVKLRDGDIESAFAANVIEPIIMTRDILDTHDAKPLDLIYTGSTAGYSGGVDMSVYCATKFALRGFVESMNAEYAGSHVRFSLVSTGTMNTRMGREYADRHGRPVQSLMDPLDVAKRIVSSVLRPDGIFSSEMILRYR